MNAKTTGIMWGVLLTVVALYVYKRYAG